jgi:hypothetical protein
MFFGFFCLGMEASLPRRKGGKTPKGRSSVVIMWYSGEWTKPKHEFSQRKCAMVLDLLSQV